LRRHERSLAPAKKTAKGRGQGKQLPELRLTVAQQHRREQLQASYRRVQGLYEQGHNLREIAKMVGIDTNTLRYFVQSQPWVQAYREPKSRGADLAPYLPYLHKRWKAGCRNGRLMRDIRSLLFVISKESSG
jgi:hypothetical protein